MGEFRGKNTFLLKILTLFENKLCRLPIRVTIGFLVWPAAPRSGKATCPAPTYAEKAFQFAVFLFLSASFPGTICTDKKENQIFLVYKEIQSGAAAKSYMREGCLTYEEMHKYFPASGFWPRVRARALRAPVLLGSLPRKTGRCAPTPPPAHRSFAASHSTPKNI